MKPVKRAVFPVAGLGTRFLPATKSQPKEMLPVIDKPVIQYLAEEAAASGIEEIVLITGKGKAAIEDHFDHSFELEQRLMARGKKDLLEEVQRLSDIAKFIYVRQPQPLGDGHALLCAKEILEDEPFAVLFGDDIVDYPVPALRQLLNVFEEKETCVLGLKEFERKSLESYGVIAPADSFGGGLHSIADLVEKPKPELAPSNLGIIGKYVLTPDIFPALEKATAGHADGDLRLIDGLKILMKKREIFGQEILGERYDTGDKFGFVKAVIDFSLKRPDLAEKLKSHLRSIDLTD